MELFRGKLTARAVVVVLLMFATFCGPRGAHGQSAAQKAAFTALVNRQLRSWQKADFSIAADDWAPDGVLTSPGGHLKKAEIQAAMTDYFKHFKDLNVVVKRVILSPSGKEAVIEWQWNAMRIRDGAVEHSDDCIVIDLASGKIRSWREYFDFGGSIEANP